MRVLSGFVGAAVLGYLALVTLFYFQQNRFVYPAPQDLAVLPAGFEDVELATSDGLRLRAMYRQASGDKPTAIFFHGNGGSLSGSVAATERLANRGVGLLLVEYRGYGGNAGAPSEQGFYRDGRAAIAFMESRGVDHSDLVLIGNSIGGGTATQLATEIGPKALILISAFSSLPDVAAEKMGWLPVRLIARDNFANADKISAIRVPVLIQHGEADDLIPFDHAKTLAAAQPNAVLQPFPSAGHDLAFWPEAQSAQYIWLAALGAEPSVNAGAGNVSS